MHCPKCGTELRDGSKFCSKCGSSIGVSQEKERESRGKNGPAARPAAAVKKQGTVPAAAPTPRKRGTGLIIALLALLLALALAGGAGAYFYFGSRNDEAALESVRNEFSGTEDEEEGDASLESELPSDVTEGLRETETAAMPTEAATVPETAAMPTEAATVPETAAMPTEAVPTTVYAGEGASQSEKIQYIRDAYNRIVANLGACRQDGGNYYDGNGMLVKKAVSNGNTVIDSAMRSNGYAAYSLEYYYDDQYPSPYPIFIFAVIDGKEYRYYFNNGNFIRRVGPEGSVNDSPEMNSFITTLRDEGYSDR